MKNIFKQKKGITLIALVITIIVLLILAGISIGMLSGNNSLLRKAGEAKEQTGDQAIAERVQLAYLGALSTEIGTKTEDTLKDLLEDELDKEFGSENYILADDLSKVTINGKDYIFNRTASGGGNNNNSSPVNDSSKYRGLATGSEARPDIYFYKINSSENKTASILGIDLIHIFEEAFNTNKDNFPNYSENVSQYETKLNSYVNKLVIPYETYLDNDGKYSSNGQKYTITEIESLRFPDGNVIRIGYEFLDLWNLWESNNVNMNIIFPEGITYITEFGWSNKIDKSLKSVKLPNTLKTLGGLCQECPNLTSVDLPDGLETIWWGAFLDCTGLTSITIPDSVTTIESAFEGCENLKTVSGPLGIMNRGDGYDGWPMALETFIGTSGTSIKYEEFAYHDFLKNITIPSSVTTIGTDAFNNCLSLKSINLPGGVTDEYGEPYTYEGCEHHNWSYTSYSRMEFR